MTDPDFADATYIEPITWQVIESIIAKEKPDAILPTLGGQTALNAAIDLHKHGILDKYGVELIGATIEAIQRGEDREQFKQIVLGMTDIPGGARGGPLGDLATRWTRSWPPQRSWATRWWCARRSPWVASAPASRTTRRSFAASPPPASHQSPMTEVLIEESILGWKEYELEVMRDQARQRRGHLLHREPSTRWACTPATRSPSPPR